jgi:hypothetical protein
MTFESEFPQKEYCSVRCRRAAKDQRAVARSPRVSKTQAPSEIRLHNPTIEQLAALSVVYAANANPIPATLTGEVPTNWTPPPGVVFVKQMTMDNSDQWLLTSQKYVDEH